MNFNWILNEDTDEKLQRFCIDLEYKLRPRITRFLMAHLDEECDGDFSNFHFDVDMVQKRIFISEKTPSEYLQKIRSDFDFEIGRNCC